jgi:hypothetical protein
VSGVDCKTHVIDSELAIAMGRKRDPQALDFEDRSGHACP